MKNRGLNQTEDLFLFYIKKSELAGHPEWCADQMDPQCYPTDPGHFSLVACPHPRDQNWLISATTVLQPLGRGKELRQSAESAWSAVAAYYRLGSLNNRYSSLSLEVAILTKSYGAFTIKSKLQYTKTLPSVGVGGEGWSFQHRKPCGVRASAPHPRLYSPRPTRDLWS